MSWSEGIGLSSPYRQLGRVWGGESGRMEEEIVVFPRGPSSRPRRRVRPKSRVEEVERDGIRPRRSGVTYLASCSRVPGSG